MESRSNPWMPLLSRGISTLRLYDLKDSGETLTVEYRDHAGSLQRVSFRVKYQMDDDGPWVAETTDGKWVLLNWGRQTGRFDVWSLILCDERPRQWFEGLAAR